MNVAWTSKRVPQTAPLQRGGGAWVSREVRLCLTTVSYSSCEEGTDCVRGRGQCTARQQHNQTQSKFAGQRATRVYVRRGAHTLRASPKLQVSKHVVVFPEGETRAQGGHVGKHGAVPTTTTMPTMTMTTAG
jgi:hypothetical protein